MKKSEMQMTVPEVLAKKIRRCAKLSGVPPMHVLSLLVRFIDPERYGGDLNNLEVTVVRPYPYPTRKAAATAAKRFYGDHSLAINRYGRRWRIVDEEPYRPSSNIIEVSFDQDAPEPIEETAPQ